MKRSRTGIYLPVSRVDEVVKAFVPEPLPPDPPLNMDDDLREIIDHALLAVGRLDSATLFLPDTHLFLYQYVRKEAVLSSQIEGTQSSLSELMLFELEGLPGAPTHDVREVSRYVAALEHGLRRLKSGFPLSLRLIKDMHRVLLKEGRGSEKTPGEFRESQNWIGGTRPGNATFVPPPAGHVLECMGKLELFLHNRFGRFNPLVKAALAHAQFETIHPFLDGNGRLGRLLVTLMLCEEGLLAEPLLYLSLYFKQHRSAYYEHLQRLRVEGDWEAWVRFFLEAVRVTAQQAVTTAQRLVELTKQDRARIGELKRLAGSALRVHHELLTRPIASVALLCQRTGLVPNTVAKVLRALIKAGIVKEITGKSRNRVFVYRRCLDIMSEGTESTSTGGTQ